MPWAGPELSPQLKAFSLLQVLVYRIPVFPQFLVHSMGVGQQGNIVLEVEPFPGNKLTVQGKVKLHRLRRGRLPTPREFQKPCTSEEAYYQLEMCLRPQRWRRAG